MHLEEALERLQTIIGDIENKQLPLHEVMKLHEEGKKLVGHSEKLLKDAKNRLKLTEVEIDSVKESGEGSKPTDEATSNESEISLF